MGHTMKNSGADCAQDVESYTNPNIPLHEELSQAIVNFIRS